MLQIGNHLVLMVYFPCFLQTVLNLLPLQEHFKHGFIDLWSHLKSMKFNVS